MVGVGQGGATALSFAVRFGDVYAATLRSVVMVNSFANVDSQLSAILHSSVNVFSCFPGTRPDLPVNYFSRFVFSEAYTSRVRRRATTSMTMLHACTHTDALCAHVCEGSCVQPHFV
jgi:hypothetical protein